MASLSSTLAAHTSPIVVIPLSRPLALGTRAPDLRPVALFSWWRSTTRIPGIRSGASVVLTCAAGRKPLPVMAFRDGASNIPPAFPFVYARAYGFAVPRTRGIAHGRGDVSRCRAEDWPGLRSASRFSRGIRIAI